MELEIRNEMIKNTIRLINITTTIIVPDFKVEGFNFSGLVTPWFEIPEISLKGILAFSTVSQLGLIMSLLGAGAISFHTGIENENSIFKYAAFAAIFHLINHATFKGSLFMIAGVIDHETGTRDIRKLGGLMSFMPISFSIAMIGSLSMAGLPPFNGFLSKELFLIFISK